jgi:hypothetical protein
VRKELLVLLRVVVCLMRFTSALMSLLTASLMIIALPLHVAATNVDLRSVAANFLTLV